MDRTTVEHPNRDRVLDPTRTAVLVVDVQMDEISDGKRAKEPYYVQEIENRAVPAIGRLIDALRPRGAEIIYTVIESLTRNGRDRSLDHKLSGIHLPKGSPLSKVITAVAPEEDDIVLPKTSSGVFNSTNIDYVLRNIGIENLIVVGFVTDQCVDMAVRDGADLGYYVVCASDGCATYSEERHDFGLKSFGGYCRLQTVDEVIATIAPA